MKRILYAPDPPGGGGTPPTPAIAPASGGGSALSDLIKDDDSPPAPPAPTPAATPDADKTPPAAPAAPKPPAAPPAPPKPAPTPPRRPKPAPPTPAEKALDWKTAPEQFRTAHEKLLQTKQAIETEYQQFKTTNATQQSEVQRKLADLEKKRYWTPEDESKYASLERRSKDIEAELYARDFEASPQYKAEFTEKWNEAYTDAVNAVVSMEVTVKGDDGEEKTRSATKRDFESIRALTGDPSAQRKLAKQLFGEDADIVLGHTRTLVGIEKDAAKAVAAKRGEYEANLKTYLENSQNVSRAQHQASEAAEQDLIKTHPQFFGDDPNDPKAGEALKRGLEFVDNSYSREATAKMTPMQLAERATVLRYMAGAFPRLCSTIKRLQADNASKDEELKKYRGTDPGAGGDGPASAPTDKKNEGTKSLEEQLAALDD